MLNIWDPPHPSELQRIIQSIENRERTLVRQNFNLEALFYQLKSRYMMVLNHFHSSDQPKKGTPAFSKE